MIDVKPLNLILVISDQHNRNALGFRSGGQIKTPHVDRLAAAGRSYVNAYCNSPICVPARASLATGRFPHQITSWDNADPYYGQVPSWGHALGRAGHHVTTIGKLHYRSEHDDTGFPDQRFPLHVAGGIGDLYSLIRADMDVRQESRDEVLQAHTGVSDYVRYDERIKLAACEWIAKEAPSHEKPWVLVVSFVAPHYPLIVPSEWIEPYIGKDIRLPGEVGFGPPLQEHAAIKEMRRVLGFDKPLDRQIVAHAREIYFGLCSLLDSHIGDVLAALANAGMNESTRVIYTSDHGDSIGAHGMWWKHSMYEDSVGVPLIMAGHGVEPGESLEVVSHVDLYPTILDAVGVQGADGALPGTSLFESDLTGRSAFVEYHAEASITGAFALRHGSFKYVEWAGMETQLFDLARDPGETMNLAANAAYSETLTESARQLRAMCEPNSPEEISARAFEDQARRIAEYGGMAGVRALGNSIPFTPVPTTLLR